MEVIKGIIKKAVKTCLYGPEGVGKSTFASQFPEALFIDTEDSTVNMDVARLPKPSSWTMLLAQIDYVKKNPHICKTLIIDTADWAERLCIDHICTKAQVDGIESFGYGKGYVYLEEEFGRLLNRLQDIIEIGINVVVTAHAEIKKIEQPEEIGGFDHWQLKLEKKTMPLLKEWADILLFANYKVFVVNIDNQGSAKGKNKAQGGKRVMYTTHTPWWDAKNRHGLPDELPLDYKAIAHCIPDDLKKTKTSPNSTTREAIKKEPEPTIEQEVAVTKEESKQVYLPISETSNEDLSGVPKSLADLMTKDGVKTEEIQKAVSSKGYYPANTPIENYDPNFIAGVLVAAWPQVFQLIQDLREDDIPF